MMDRISLAEAYVRKISYQLWNSAGRPEGLSAKFWDMACDIAGDYEDFMDD